MIKIFLAFFLAEFSSIQGSADVISVPAGFYKPLLGKGEKISVPSFLVDETPVQNSEFLKFVKENSKWQKSKAKSLFVDQSYLKNWQGDTVLGASTSENSPVVYVSWFAAKAFCESRGARLPRVDEWEYLAQFGPKGDTQDAKKAILEWYSKPTPEKIPSVKTTFKNQFGVWDVHGLIWEWTLDFATTFVTGESRGDASLEKSMFCGGGAIGAVDPSDYASYMRFGFRSSLKANYTVGNLGFRCVKDSSK